MVRIRLLEKNLGNWALAKHKNDVKNFLSKTGCVFTNNIFNADIIYSIWHRSLSLKRYFYLIKFLKKIKRVKVIGSVTHITTSYDKEIGKLNRVVDYWVAPNKKTYDLLKSKGLRVELIPFYVDKRIFRRLGKDKKEICKELQIDYNKIRGKILIGSFQRDSLGSDLTKPKWQKNPGLLIKILNELPKDKFVLILAGPRRHYIINQCKRFAIPYLFLGNKKYINELKDDLVANNIDVEKIALLYNLIDLYIVSSKVEGGPMAILEASLSKVLIVSTEVGLAPDILHKDLIYEENNYQKVVNFIKDIIGKKLDIKKYLDYNYRKVTKALEKEGLIKKYKSIIKNVCY